MSVETNTNDPIKPSSEEDVQPSGHLTDKEVEEANAETKRLERIRKNEHRREARAALLGLIILNGRITKSKFLSLREEFSESDYNAARTHLGKYKLIEGRKDRDEQGRVHHYYVATSTGVGVLWSGRYGQEIKESLLQLLYQRICYSALKEVQGKNPIPAEEGKMFTHHREVCVRLGIMREDGYLTARGLGLLDVQAMFISLVASRNLDRIMEIAEAGGMMQTEDLNPPWHALDNAFVSMGLLKRDSDQVGLGDHLPASQKAMKQVAMLAVPLLYAIKTEEKEEMEKWANVTAYRFDQRVINLAAYLGFIESGAGGETLRIVGKYREEFGEEFMAFVRSLADDGEITLKTRVITDKEAREMDYKGAIAGPEGTQNPVGGKDPAAPKTCTSCGVTADGYIAKSVIFGYRKAGLRFFIFSHCRECRRAKARENDAKKAAKKAGRK